MKRIERAFQAKKPFIAYLTAGDGGMDYSLECFLALIEGGVDLLEIGIPFSDPVADGPVIQKAMQRSLEANTKPRDVLELVKKIRQKSNVPIVLFSYYNPILQAGKSFVKEAKDAGADGFLIVDLPLEESDPFVKECKEKDLDFIFLIAPSTPPERRKTLAEKASGFLYYVMRKGTTGMRQGLPEGFEEKMVEIKKEIQIPIACGFGVSNRETAASILEIAAGFVVGSFFVKAVGERISPAELCKLAKGMAV